MDKREQLIRAWAKSIYGNGLSGALLGESVKLAVHGVCGPRAGALEIGAGVHAVPLFDKMHQREGAFMRQTIPWNFTGDPICFMRGRYVRVEAGWEPGDGVSKIPLSSIGQCPHDEVAKGRWTVGRNEHWARIYGRFKDSTPHFLIGGATGSGKSTAIRSALTQCLQSPVNRFVMIDGKMLESLGVFRDVAGRIGPIASDLESTRAALSWTVTEMLERYRRLGQGDTLEDRIIIAFDEFQYFTEDRGVAALLSRIASQGRAAKVHLLIATQHPSIGCFGDPSTARELTGRLALYVTDGDASRVVVGSSDPRADRLLGNGDSYMIVPGATHRIQGLWVEQSDFDTCEKGPPEFEAWPAVSGSPLENDGPGRLRPITPPEVAMAVRTALAPLYRKRPRGRDYLGDMMVEAGLTRPGGGRLNRIVKLGREVVADLQEAPDIEISWTGKGANE